MKKFFSFLFVLFVLQSYNAQKIKTSKDSIDKAIQETIKVDFSNNIKADEAMEKLKKIYSHSKKIDYKNGMLESGNNIMIFYYRKAQYESAIEFASDLENNINLEKYNNFYLISRFYRNLAISYIKLGFEDKGKAEYANAIASAKKIKNEDEFHFILGTIYNDKAKYYDQTKKYPDTVGYYFFKALKEIELLKDKDKIKKIGGKLFIYSSIGFYYLEVSQPRDTALAKKYFIKSEEIYNQSSTPMLTINEVEFLLTLSQFYFIEKNYSKVIALTEKAMSIEKNNPTNVYQRKRIYEFLTKSYLELGNAKESKKYMNLFYQITDSLYFAVKNRLKTPIDKTIEKNTKINSQQTQKILVSLAIILVLTSTIIFIVVRKNQKKTHENYKILIQKLKENNQSPLQERSDKETTEKNTIEENISIQTTTKISDETANQLLLRLNKFEHSNGFLKKDLTLTSLAHSLRTNPKYLSEIIKENKSKSFNNYINNLRINYITNKLYKVPAYRNYKIKYMAKECGYASPQVFVIAFKKENGVTPSYYVEQLKKENKYF